MKLTWMDTHIHVSDIGADGMRRESMLDDLMELLDRCDADLRFVISCDGPYMSGIGGDPEQMLPANRMIYELVRQAPGRLYGACMVNPNFLEESLHVMEVCFEEWGFAMLGEMLQYMMRYRMDSDNAEKVVRLAVQYDVPVQVHLGTYWFKDDYGGSTDGMNHMRDLLKAVDRVPEAKWILAHAIGVGPTPAFVPWADMFLDTIAGVFTECPENFWIEIRDFQSPALRRTLELFPSGRILAGTDWTTRIGPPFQSYGTMFDVAEDQNPFPAKVASFVTFLREAGASEDEVSRIAFQNARDLFKLNDAANSS